MKIGRSINQNSNGLRSTSSIHDNTDQQISKRLKKHLGNPFFRTENRLESRLSLICVVFSTTGNTIIK